MTKTVELCGKCAALLREAATVVKVGGGADHKVRCEQCRRQRYGGTYEITTPPRGARR